jgi:hypothetical protein
MHGISRQYRPRLEALETRLTPANNPNLVVPVFNSLPGAPATIYLDFTGHFDATWNVFTNIDTPPFDRDGNTNAFSAAELADIQTIARNVAEDYAPFRINVTTVQPASFAPGVALRIAIGGDGAWLGAQAGGVALLDTFATGAGGIGGNTPTCFKFAALFGPNAKAIADGCSHEAGHMFGLNHQSEYSSALVKTNEYYAGLNNGTAPIMGVSYVATRSLWWNGTSSTSASVFQNDMTVIAKAANGFGFRADDHGNAPSTATVLPGKGAASVKVNQNGLIGQEGDSDWFRFSARPGPVTFTADVPNPNNNLDVRLELRNSAGAIIASADPGGSFDATISANISKGGTYFLVVAGHGVISPGTANNHGIDVGTYQLTGSFTPLIEAVEIYNPVRWRRNRSTGILSGMVTVTPSFSLNGPFTLSIKLPHPSVEWASSQGTRSGNTVRLDFNKNLATNKPFRFVVQLRNPRHHDLGTFFKGLIIGMV